jgi:ATP-dependent helicase/nuclease subunit A
VTPVEAGSSSGIRAHRGIVTHRVLEHLDFSIATDAAGLARELQRLSSEGIVSDDEQSAVMSEGLAWFVTTPLADSIRGAGDQYRREFRYTSTEALSDFDPTIPACDDDRVLMRGIVDGVIATDSAIELVDFKTDAIDQGEVAKRMDFYRPQMTAYRRAMSRVWRLPVTNCWLVFLTPRRVVACDQG